MNDDKALIKFQDYSEESSKAVLKIVLSSLGPIGAAIDESIYGIGERVRGRRLERFVKEMSDKLQELNKSKIDRDYLESEDFYDLNVAVFNSAVKTASDEKLKMLKNVYINSIEKKIKWESDLAQILINHINSLTVNHIVVLKFLVENMNKLENLNSYQNLFEMFSDQVKNDYDKYEFRLYVRDLENLTIFRFSRDINEYGSSGGYLETESRKEVKGVMLTTIGKEICKLLK